MFTNTCVHIHRVNVQFALNSSFSVLHSAQYSWDLQRLYPQKTLNILCNHTYSSKYVQPSFIKDKKLIFTGWELFSQWLILIRRILHSETAKSGITLSQHKWKKWKIYINHSCDETDIRFTHRVTPVYSQVETGETVLLRRTTLQVVSPSAGHYFTGWNVHPVHVLKVNVAPPAASVVFILQPLNSSWHCGIVYRVFEWFRVE